MSHATASFPLTAIPTTVAPVGPSDPTAPAGTLFTAADKFGRGLTHPFRRDGKGDFANTVGVALVRSAATQILGTRAETDFNEGELAWNPEFGSKLHLLKHAPNNQATAELARIFSIEAVGRWEPRIRITDVDVRSEDPTRQDVLTISAKFNFIDLQSGTVIFEQLEVSIVV